MLRDLRLFRQAPRNSSSGGIIFNHWTPRNLASPDVNTVIDAVPVPGSNILPPFWPMPGTNERASSPGAELRVTDRPQKILRRDARHGCARSPGPTNRSHSLLLQT